MSGRTLAERLSMAVGVDLSRGDIAIVEAVERIREENDRNVAALASLVEQRDEAIADLGQHLARAERAVEARERALALLDVTQARERVLASEVERLREQRDAAIDEANELRREIATGRTESLYAGSPAADGRAVQALLDAYGVPHGDLGPVVRVMWLIGQLGLDLAEGER